MSNITEYIANNSKLSNKDYDTLFREFSDKFGSGLPNFEKNENLKRDFFNYSIEFAKEISSEYIEQYHNWLIANYDLVAKH